MKGKTLQLLQLVGRCLVCLVCAAGVGLFLAMIATGWLALEHELQKELDWVVRQGQGH